MIGDNLSSHLSDESIRLCQENGIRMVFLPENSTDKSQPLDVAFFRPTKAQWGQILTQWKQGAGRRETTAPKDIFPRLLKQLLVKSEVNAGENIKSGFKKCGIHPFNPLEVLKRIPDKEDYVSGESSTPVGKDVDAALIQIFNDKRGFQNKFQAAMRTR